jgi:hypothetical protein
MGRGPREELPASLEGNADCALLNRWPTTHRRIQSTPSRQLDHCTLAAALAAARERRSISLEALWPHRMSHGAKGVGARCWQRSHITHTHGVTRRRSARVATVRLGSLHGMWQSGSVARISPVQVVPDGCTPFFCVRGAPPEPLGMITGP